MGQVLPEIIVNKYSGVLIANSSITNAIYFVNQLLHDGSAVEENGRLLKALAIQPVILRWLSAFASL